MSIPILSTDVLHESTSISLPSKCEFGGENAAKELTVRQIDLWEHAALLYHGYEWQAAAETFHTLSQIIESVEWRTLCLLNAGLIQARLGDYDGAAAPLGEAAMIDQTFAMTSLIAGIISYELGDNSKAEGCFEMCLDGLGYGAIDHDNVGMNFVLDKPILHDNLRAVRRTQFSASFSRSPGSQVEALSCIPAEYIFEAPPRMDSTIAITQNVNWPGVMRRMLETPKRSEVFAPPVPTKATDLPYSPSPAKWLQGLRSATPYMSSPREPLSSISEQFERVSAIMPTSGPLSSSAPTTSSAISGTRISWKGRPTTPYVPRDARVKPNSTKELATYIRTASADKLRNLVPKDAKGEYHSVEELANFAEHYAPENVSNVTQPLDLDPYMIANMRMDRLLNAAYDEDDMQILRIKSSINGSGPKPNEEGRDSISANRPGPRQRGYFADWNRTLQTAWQPTSPLPVSNPEQGPLEILQPTIFKRAKRRETVQIDSDYARSSPSHTTTVDTAPTSASSSDSCQEGSPPAIRKEIERDRALQLLEGRSTSGSQHVGKALKKAMRDKPLPPDPSGSSMKISRKGTETPQSVATMDFFDRVLRHSMRKK